MRVYVLPPSGLHPTYLSGEWTVPKKVSAISVEAIGSGGGGANANGFFGGGGGAYAKTNLLRVTPGQKVYYRSANMSAPVILGGIDSWLNVETNSAPQSKDVGVLAKGGFSGTPSTGNGIGGQASQCIGDIAFSGGNGGLSSGGGGGGGGGAAGPNGPGARGGAGYNASTDGGGGGGGANGGFDGESALISPGTAGDGGNNRFGLGKGLAAPSLIVRATNGTNGGGGGGCLANASSPTVPVNFRIGANGGMEVIWTDTTTSVQAGPGGGGGGSRGISSGGGGASYGGGGGAGGGGVQGNGLIVITAFEWFENPSDPNTWTPDAPDTNVWQNVPEQSNSWS